VELRVGQIPILLGRVGGCNMVGPHAERRLGAPDLRGDGLCGEPS
jgi:hypothetical protein